MGAKECLEYMKDWYFADTIELLDLVLTDDTADPQYSAITTLNRLWVYLEYQKNANPNFECCDITSFLEKMNYTSEDIDLFRKKVYREQEIYTDDILDTHFLEE